MFISFMLLWGNVFSKIAIAATDTEIAKDIWQTIKAVFGGNMEEGDVMFTTNACSIDVGITNIKGVFGDASFNKTYQTSFWTFSLGMTGREGFIQRDILEVTGQIQHKNDRCDSDRDNDAGGPLQYQLFLDLNNENTRNKINANHQININNPPEIPNFVAHPIGNKTHQDVLITANLFANIFDATNGTNLAEIGQTSIQLKAKHIPEPLTILGTGVVLGAIPVLKKKYDKSNKKKDEDA